MKLYIWRSLMEDAVIEDLLLARTDAHEAEKARRLWEDEDALNDDEEEEWKGDKALDAEGDWGRSLRRATAALLPFAEKEAWTDQIYREYIIRKMVAMNNVFSQACFQYSSIEEMEGLAPFVLSDLSHILHRLLQEDWNGLAEQMEVLPLIAYRSGQKRPHVIRGFDQSIIEMVHMDKAEELMKALFRHIRTFGSGAFAAFPALKWQRGELTGIEEIDAMPLESLVGVEEQKHVLIENTEAFLRGQPANHVLLCGAMGSGKSSAVKALIDYFAKDRLRLVEVDKSDIPTLDQLLNEIEPYHGKFILFLDDLSFEGNDEKYTLLKKALDGQLERSNQNILYYATSNRRNIVRDSWAERSGDVHENDTLNERYSLSERFGIKLFFPSYDQLEYIAIVQSKLAEAGIEMTEEIRKEALLWERMYHGRSGRTAANFAKNYIAQQKNQ